MKQNPFPPLLFSLCIRLSLIFSGVAKGETPEQHKPALHCSKSTLPVVKALPELDYSCEDKEEDSLKSLKRKQALQKQMKRFEQFTSPAWWTASVDELNVCAEFKKPYVLRDNEFYKAAIYGDSQTRLLITDDPCVKYSYGTLNVFVLQRNGNLVTVTQVMDGYFSRADNAVSLNIADTGSERILEINAGTGGLQPYRTSRLYTIDKRTGRAIPKKLIKDGKTFTNEMTSCGAPGVWADKFEIEIPRSWQETTIIKNGRLTDKFYVYNDIGNKLERTTFKWNGRDYEVQKTPAGKRRQSTK